MRVAEAAVPVLACLLAGCGDQPPASGDAAQAASPDGKALYTEHCAVCHQSDLRGVPNLQPSLVDSPIVTGPPAASIAVTLQGASGSYGNAMPGFAYLSDAQVAAILSYVRTDPPHAAKPAPGPVSPEQVAQTRADLGLD